MARSKSVFGIVFIAGLASASTTSASAAELRMPIVKASLGAACDHVVPVCGFMKNDRMVSFDSECSARAAGAPRTVVGDCFDAD